MSTRILSTVFAFLVVATSALAQPPWTVEASYNVPAGKKGHLTFKPNLALRSLAVTLTDDGGTTQRKFKAKGLSAGRAKTFRFKVPSGRSTWTASFEGQTRQQTLRSKFRFEVVSVGPLKVDLDKSGVDLAGGRLKLKTNQRLAKAELRGFSPDGELILDSDVELPNLVGRVPVEFTPVENESLRRLEIKVFDPVGRWVSFRLVAWYVEIPHDDVVFATGSAEIAGPEAGKLDAVVGRVQAEIKAFRDTLGRQDVGLNLKLYVAGCTDTVGSAADNLVLSRRRAHSIAKYFRKRGVSAPIFYEGYGEALLAVPTADNIEEARNRRAIYVLTNTEPTAYARSGHRWHALK